MKTKKKCSSHLSEKEKAIFTKVKTDAIKNVVRLNYNKYLQVEAERLEKESVLKEIFSEVPHKLLETSEVLSSGDENVVSFNEEDVLNIEKIILNEIDAVFSVKEVLKEASKRDCKKHLLMTDFEPKECFKEVYNNISFQSKIFVTHEDFDKYVEFIENLISEHRQDSSPKI